MRVSAFLTERMGMPMSDAVKSDFHLERFIEAQRYHYEKALSELKQGRKESHWMWFIFPQIKGLGGSEMSKYYAISGREEAKAYLAHPLLSARLRELCSVLLSLQTNDARAVFGTPDDKKLRSSMTLFHLASPIDTCFFEVIEKFFDGKTDQRTEKIWIG